MKKKETASSASSWATFKEEIPKKMHKGPEVATDPGATLMGRLASRMTARDMIDQVNLGPKAKATNAKRAQIADDSETASATHPSIHAPRAGRKIAAVAPTVADSIPTKMFLGAGLHEQTKDKKSSNFSNPIPEGKKASGSNFYDQAVNSGNVVESKEFREKFGIRGRETSDHLNEGDVKTLAGEKVKVKKKLNKGYVVKEL